MTINMNMIALGSKHIHNSSQDSAEMRAKRLKRIRNLANLSREELCTDGEINRHTLIGWENGRFGGLTTSGAEKIIAKVKREGVYCTIRWLMEGEGQAPFVNPAPVLFEDAALSLCENEIIDYECSFFMVKNLNAVNLTINDDSMLPQYHKGDVVAGKKRSAKEIEKIIGYDCIVEIDTGEILFRNIRKGDSPRYYTLVCNNPAFKAKNSVMANVQLNYAAPVIWHRRKDIL